MERIGREVEQTLRRSGRGAVAALAEITASWSQAVGAEIARQAWPLRLGRDGTLHVAASSATWAFELDRMSPEIGERLAALLGESAPHKIRFRVGPIPEPGASEEESPLRRQVPAQVSPEASAAADSAASAIDDPELRELAARAARASLSQARSGRAFW